MIELFVRNRQQAGASFIPEDASEESCVDFSRRRSSTLCQPTHRAFEKVWGSAFWAVYYFFFGRASCLSGGCSFGWGCGWTVSNLLDWRGAGEEGAQDVRDAGQTGRMAADPGPHVPNRRLWEGADVCAVLAEKLEAERMCNLVLTALGDIRDPLQ